MANKSSSDRLANVLLDRFDSMDRKIEGVSEKVQHIQATLAETKGAKVIERLDEAEKQIASLTGWRLFLMGGAAVIGALVSALISFLHKG